MIQKIKNIVTAMAFALALAVPVAVPSLAAAAGTDIGGSLCSGSEFKVSSNPGTTADCNKDGNGNGEGINNLLKKVVNIISAIVGVVAVIMIIFGGFKYITSGGDSNNVSGAKNTIIYAIIGLVIVALAQLVVHFVLNQANSIS